jgi:hypothetical protein
MRVILGVIAFPALIFAIFAVALNLNPVRAAAFGAIVGMAVIAWIILHG